MASLVDMAKQLTAPQSTIMRAVAKNGVSIAATSANGDDLTIPDFLKRERTPESDKRTAKITARDKAMRGDNRGKYIKTPTGKKTTGLGANPFDLKPKAGAPAKAAKQETTTMATKKTTKSKARTSVKAPTTKTKTTVDLRPDGLKPGTKKALIADTIVRKQGATEAEMNKILGWQGCMVTVRRVCAEAGITLEGKPDEKAGTTRWFGTAKKAKAA